MRTPRPCRSWREPLRELVDGHASLESVAAVERHAETCAGCAAELAVARRMRGLLDGASEGELTRAGEESFIDGVFARIDGEVEPTGLALVPSAPGRSSRPAPRRVAVLGAASVALAAAAAVLLMMRGDAERPSQPESGPVITPDANVASATSDAEPTPPETPAPAETERVLVLGSERAPVDLASFAAALEGAIASTGFEPGESDDLDALIGELDGFDPTDLARGARGVLRGTGPASLRGAAARLLGPGADARDRALIASELDSLEGAAALALLDGGARGLALLWSAAEDAERGGSAALDALVAASATGEVDPLGSMPASVDPAIAARVAVANPRRAASDLLGRFTATGEVAWLDAWASRTDAGEALALRLERGPTRGPARARLVRAASIKPIGEALPVVMSALLDGDGGAPDALAALLPLGGAEALLRATASGRLPAEVEDAAWRAAIDADVDTLLATALDEGAAGVLVGATVRSWESSGLDLAALRLLVRLAVRAEGPRALRPRIDALLHIAALDVEDEGAHPALLDELAPLRQDEEPRIAAAAWMAWQVLGGELLEAPVGVERALLRGGPPTAVHARLTRAVQRVSGLRRQ